MLLKIPDCHSSFLDSGPEPIVLSRSPETRESWVKFYEAGHRLCRVSFCDVNCHALLLEKPLVIKGKITFKLGLFIINEVWGGLDGRLSCIFIKLNGATYMGSAIDGWKFSRCVLPFAFSPQRPSGEAGGIALDFLQKNAEKLLTNETIYYERNPTTARPSSGTDITGGAFKTAPLL